MASLLPFYHCRCGQTAPAWTDLAVSFLITSPSPTLPYLERYPEQGGPAERIVLGKLPLTLGRAETVDHVIYSAPVSKEHAAIIQIGHRYFVRDLQSTNGTFVNGQRVDEQVLEDGDI